MRGAGKAEGPRLPPSLLWQPQGAGEAPMGPRDGCSLLHNSRSLLSLKKGNPHPI